MSPQKVMFKLAKELCIPWVLRHLRKLTSSLILILSTIGKTKPANSSYCFVSETLGARTLKKGRWVPGADSERSGGQPVLGRERQDCPGQDTDLERSPRARLEGIGCAVAAGGCGWWVEKEATLGCGGGAAGLEGWQEAVPNAGWDPQEEPDPAASSSGKPRPSGTPQALVFLALVKWTILQAVTSK